VVYRPDEDAEGFSAGAGQFDSDITDGRYPRAALGISRDVFVVVACDGRRSRVDAGLGCSSSRGSWPASAARARSTSTAAARRRCSWTAKSSITRRTKKASARSATRFWFFRAEQSRIFREHKILAGAFDPFGFRQAAENPGNL